MKRQLAVAAALTLFGAATAESGDFGVRLLGGYSFATSSRSYGVDAMTAGAYYASPSEGMTAFGEVLYDFGSGIAVGIGTGSLLGFDEGGRSSTRTGGDYLTSKASLKFESRPLAASLYLQRSLWKRMSLHIGAGIGWAGASNMDEWSETDEMAGTTRWRDEYMQNDTYGHGILYRGVVGVEYPLGWSLSVFVSGVFTAARWGIEERAVSGSSWRHSPTEDVYQVYTEIITYTSEAPPRGRATTTVTDNRVSGTGQVVTVSVSPSGYSRTATTYESYVLTGSRTESYRQARRFFHSESPISVLAGVAWYF